LLREAVIKTAAAELGCALRLAPVTARMRCETALDLVDHLPGTVAAQQTGDLDSYRARLIADKLAVLPIELRGRVERRVLPAATARTLAGFRRVIDREVIAADPAATRRRVERAKASRTVYTTRGENDTGIFTAVISAIDAELASATLDTIAASLTAAGLIHGRTTDQLRADAFTDLVRALATTGHATIGSNPAGCCGTNAGAVVGGRSRRPAGPVPTTAAAIRTMTRTGTVTRTGAVTRAGAAPCCRRAGPAARSRCAARPP
jgi:hypothetical protein